MNNEEKDYDEIHDDMMGVSNLHNGMDLPENREVNVKNEVKSKILFVFFLVLTGLIASTGLSFFAQALTYNTKTVSKSDDGKWDIAFVDMKLSSKNGRAVEVSAPSFSDTKASFNVALNEPGDEIEYTLTIANRGSLNAKLNDIIISPTNNVNDDILYYVEDIHENDYLDVRDRKKMRVVIKYNNNSKGKKLYSKGVEIILNYVQR